VVRWIPDVPWYRRKLFRIFSFGIASLASVYLIRDYQGASDYYLYETAKLPAIAADDRDYSYLQESDTQVQDVQTDPEHWQTVTVKSGENLSVLFDRLHLAPNALFQVMSLGDETRALHRLVPGDHVHFQINEGQLSALKFEPDPTTTILITADGDGFRSQTLLSELETRIKESTGTIEQSLYQAGLDAGLSDNLVMRLISIYGWDIDFALDIRKGDKFRIIYEEKYKDGRKVNDGAILVTEFNNRGRAFRAARYTAPDGKTGYYDEDGFSMRKAFLRTPLKFNRISSGFSLSRKHPILNRIRAHRGVDYAAPSGTPVKATGDGIVAEMGKNGGYGNMIVLRHAGIYNTVYAHLLSFARGLKPGQHVEQGDIIGYVGKTGLATGPHLHYEFRVNGVHKDPLTVDLPKALRIPDRQMAQFRQQTLPLFAQLDGIGTKLASNEYTRDEMVLALDQAKTASASVR
jgi:murein DD-endopeptidase MepM/ murein hydrolase activator NlpD